MIGIIGSYNSLIKTNKNEHLILLHRKINMLFYDDVDLKTLFKNPKIRYNKIWQDWDIVDDNDF